MPEVTVRFLNQRYYNKSPLEGGTGKRVIKCNSSVMWFEGVN
jgi:hypothetical protein